MRLLSQSNSHFFLLSAFLTALPPGLIADEANRLPRTSFDVVEIIDESGRTKQLTGTIEDIAGETLTLRRGEAGQVQFLRMSDVVELRFLRSRQWDDGLLARSEGEFRTAVRLFDAALSEESRPWAWIELQSLIAQSLVQSGDRRAALNRLAQIERRDKRSRHFCYVPLVWDARLPKEQKLNMNSAELRDESAVVRLAAASSLLHEPLYQNSAINVLQRLQRTGSGIISELARTQLWRLALIDSPEKITLQKTWLSMVRTLPVECRHGPQYIIGRCHQKQHDHAASVAPLLWCAFMSPTDQSLGAIALAEAIRSHQISGTSREADILIAEFFQTYHKNSFAVEIFSVEENTRQSPKEMSGKSSLTNGISNQ